MAQKKRKNRGWLRWAVFCLSFPIAVWLVAFFVWFFWADLTRVFFKQTAKPTAEVKRDSKVESNFEKIERDASPEPIDRPPEKLGDDDRQKLDAIIKRLQQRQAGKEG